MFLEFFFLFLQITFLFSVVMLIILDEQDVKFFSFTYSIVLFLLSAACITFIDFSTVTTECFRFKVASYLNISMVVGLDPISLIFILLVTILFPIVILAAWNSIKFEIRFFYFNILFLEYCLINVFTSFDLFFFYVWFEATIVPMFLIIVVWGSKSNKIKAAFYFIVYTSIFSIPFLCAILWIHNHVGTTNMFLLTYGVVFSKESQKFLLIAFFLAFAAKLPIFPFHIWLPEAHVEAPTCGSMVLAGILLKLGYYGFIRFFNQWFSDALAYFSPLLVTICIIGCVYTALIALSQTDLKKIIAYSSVSHMNFCIIGVFSGNVSGLLGSILMSVGHGFVSTGLFFLVGVLYERTHTRIINYYSGLGLIMPVFSFFVFIFLLSNFGFPISLNFIAELLLLVSVGSWSFLLLPFLMLYSVVSVAYNLWLYVRVFHGALRTDVITHIFFDLSEIELKVIIPLAFYNSVLCFFPNLLIINLLPSLLAVSL